jgi:tRNA threonylcarbamoyladenosine biosynthesis protein TsaB
VILAAFETSTPEGSVYLSWPGGEAERLLDRKKPHSETLLPALMSLLDEANLAPDRIEALAVGVGPGAFTGLRVGLATAQGWARAAGIPLVAVPSPDALALPFLGKAGQVMTLCDARKAEVYAAFYRGLDDAGVPQRAGEVVVLAPGLLRSWWEGLGAPPALAVGNALAAARPFLEGAHGLGFSPGGEVPRASAVARTGARLLANGGALEPARLIPCYVRSPDALPRRR